MTIKMAMRISPMMYHVYPCVLIHRIHKHGADCYQPTSSSTVGSSRYCIPYLKMTFFLHGQIIISRLKNHHQFETLVSFVLGVDKRITPHTYDEKKKNYPIKGFGVSFPCSWCWKDPNNLCFTDTWWSLCGSLPFIAVIGLDHCFCGSWGNPSRYVLCLEFSAPGRPVPSLKEMAGHRPA